MTRKALGRGLGALFPQELEGGSKEGILLVALEQIRPSPWQPRREIKEEELTELVASIKAQGVLQPVLLRPAPNAPADDPAYQLIAGERRWRSAKLAGLAVIPALVKAVSDNEALEIALIENLQREDLDPIEEAEAYKKLMDVFNLTQEEVAERVGKERSSVANSLRLLRLPGPVKAALSENRITLGHAKALLGLEREKDLMGAGQMILEKELSVSDSQALVKSWHRGPEERRLKAKKGGEVTKFDRSPQIRLLEDQLRQRLGTQVRILRPHGKVGHVLIEFYSDDDLSRIFETICGR